MSENICYGYPRRAGIRRLSVLHFAASLPLGKFGVYATTEKWWGLERINVDTFRLTSGAYKLQGLEITEIYRDEYE